MAASLNDKITDVRNSARPNSAKVSSGRSPGGTTLSCDNLVGWPTASKVHFVTYQIDSSSTPVAGTQLDCEGIVSGNDIGSFTVIDGTDNGHSINDVVEMLPTAAYGQDLADALTTLHNRTGTWKPGAALIIPTIADFTNANHAHTGATSGGTLGAAAVPSLALNTQTLSNPYKFFAYRNAALNSTSGSFLKIPFDTELFDTNNNYDSVTNFRYTAPVSGFYQFSGSVSITNTQLTPAIYKNGTELIRFNEDTSAISATASSKSKPFSALLQLTASDYVEIFAFTNSITTYNVGASPIQLFFSGFLISQT